MVNSALIVWVVFIGVFGGAIGKWWFDGGFKKWLKYKHDLEKEKERLTNEKNDTKNTHEVKGK